MKGRYITFLSYRKNMKILEKIKKGLREFNDALGQDIKDENENDYPADIKDELIKSKNGRQKDLEQAQEQLWASKTTRRSQLANELSVHEDGTIKGSGNNEKEAGNTENAKETNVEQPKQVRNAKGNERVE